MAYRPEITFFIVEAFAVRCKAGVNLGGVKPSSPLFRHVQKISFSGSKRYLHKLADDSTINYGEGYCRTLSGVL